MKSRAGRVHFAFAYFCAQVIGFCWLKVIFLWINEV